MPDIKFRPDGKWVGTINGNTHATSSKKDLLDWLARQITVKHNDDRTWLEKTKKELLCEKVQFDDEGNLIIPMATNAFKQILDKAEQQVLFNELKIRLSKPEKTEEESDW